MDIPRAPMRAFADGAISKEKLLAAVDLHRRADRLIQGAYWREPGVMTTDDGGREFELPSGGCAIGCMIHNFAPGCESFRGVGERLFGIPHRVMVIIDRIHERLSPEEAQEWPTRVVTAIPVGADLTGITTTESVAGFMEVYGGVPAPGTEAADWLIREIKKAPVIT